MRPSQRRPDELRPVSFARGFTRHAEGSVLVAFGDTRVLCTASVLPQVPSFLKGAGRGWLTAEYGLLPRATSERGQREAVSGKQSGRTLEIQRLIGRSLRAALDLTRLGERTITLDCDVLQADGGTRTAAITGAWLALRDAIERLCRSGALPESPLVDQIAAVSVGLYQGIPVLDLDYAEDAAADTDMNVVMDTSGRFIEIQGTAEQRRFSRAELDHLLDLAASGIETLHAQQRAAVGLEELPTPDHHRSTAAGHASR